MSKYIIESLFFINAFIPLYWFIKHHKEETFIGKMEEFIEELMLLFQLLLYILSFGYIQAVFNNLLYFTFIIKYRISMDFYILKFTFIVVMQVLHHKRLFCSFYCFQSAWMFIAGAGYIGFMRYFKAFFANCIFSATFFICKCYRIIICIYYIQWICH